jgi:hypothetical protein
MGAFRIMDSYAKAMTPPRVQAIQHKLRHLPGAGASGPLCAHSCLGAAARAKVRSSAASRSELVEFRRTRVHDLAV